MIQPQPTVTELLVAWSDGDKSALDELMPVVYDELRRLAKNYLSRERRDHTLQTTALVHEAYLRLVDQKSVDWQKRAQFFGIAAQMMRRILINHAKDRQAKKRQGYATKVSLDEAVSFFEKREVDLMALDEALNDLATLDSQQKQDRSTSAGSRQLPQERRHSRSAGCCHSIPRRHPRASGGSAFARGPVQRRQQCPDEKLVQLAPPENHARHHFR